jgi:DNA-binding MarR family transcriptional regulator
MLSMTKRQTDEVATPRAASRAATSPAFLLAQVGGHAAAKFAERLSVLGLTPPHAGILGTIDQSEGLSQQALCERLRVMPSRLVTLVDELEQRELVERRDKPDDRRTYALHLTENGRNVLKAIGRVAREHQEALCAALTGEEREQLGRLLRRIADQQGLTPGVHPGFSRLGRKPNSDV